MGYTFPTTVDGWVALGNAYGLHGPYVPTSMYSQVLVSLNRNIKSAKNPPPATQVAELEACIILRGMIYHHNVPGDCGVPSQLDLTNAQLTGAAGGVASGIASFAGVALPGIGVAVQAIQQIFAHHAQAVATEQATLCSVANVMNQVIPYYDNLVRNGSVSPATAKQGVQAFIQQVNAQMAAIEQQCNAACVYISLFAAHSDFLNTWYPAIAPIQVASHAPGAPPTSITPTRPGGVIQVGNTYPGGTTAATIPNNSAIVATLPSQPNNIPVVAEATLTPEPTGLNSTLVIAAAIVLGFLILATSGAKHAG